MEQIMNLREIGTVPKAQAPAWRSLGSVASQLVARAEAARPLVRSAEETSAEFLAWAAE